MAVATADDINAPAAGRNVIGPCLFMAVFLFYWVTTNPYVDLTGTAVLDPSAGASSSINQIVTIGLTLSLMVYGFTHPMRSIILQPRLLLAALFPGSSSSRSYPIIRCRAPRRSCLPS
ncbi:hypothetical protein N7E02_10860 [Aliirhizobium terrae]|uniref:hypothetical protein n=1 Tax=Terrirhizobium terrae TaxID=2926709 RepID=UPI00257844F5|nr:hypothetical protein [Rhizobium sp. CC-CFT758]WJH41003.1 hypothetical protein N7E02_10860 [Rhizobium sp. CC-CFT758]